MIKRIASILLALALGCAPVKAQTFPTYWYWQVADSGPTTTVFEATSGSFVSNTSGPFTTWLAAAAASFSPVSGLASLVCGDVNNGSGLHRLTLCAAQPGWVTGQNKTVSGVVGATGANGAWTITVIDPITIDLQGAAFGGVYASGGVIGSGTAMDTAAHLYAYINSYNLILATGPTALGAGATVVNTSTSLALTNPLNRTIVAGFTAGGQSLTLPQMNLFGSMPVGYSAYIVNNGNAFTLRTFGGSPIATVLTNQIWQVTLIDNASAAGGTSSGMLFRSQPNCSDLGNAATSCSTDATNAANISSGNLPIGRMPSAGVNCGAGLSASSRTTNGLVTTC